MSNNEPTGMRITQSDLDAAKIFKEMKQVEQSGKTTRTLIVSGLILSSLAIICYTIVKVFETMGGDPPWAKIAIIVIGSIAPVTVPGFVAWRLTVKLKTFITNKTGRTIELESMIDAGRTSSGIQPDGSAVHD